MNARLARLDRALAQDRARGHSFWQNYLHNVIPRSPGSHREFFPLRATPSRMPWHWPTTNDQLMAAIQSLAQTVATGFVAVNQRIKTMSDAVGTELATIQGAVNSIASDLTAIAAQIADLQNAGTLSAANQAALDAIAASVAATQATADSMVVPPAAG